MIRWKCVCGNIYDREKPSLCIRCGNTPASKKWTFSFVKEIPIDEEKIILSNSDLFEQIVLESEKQAVGEEKAKKSLILLCMGRLVKNANATSFNGVPHEESGTGKDYLTKTITRLCVPDEELQHRTRISPTVLNYWHSPKKEPDFTWDGQVLFLEDVSDAVLNCEVVKTFLSGGSKATITVNGEAQDIEIRGKPVCLFTTANSSPRGEQLRRVQFIPLDAGAEQTGRIKNFRAKCARAGRNPEFDSKFQSALGKLERYEVVVPFSEEVASFFPDELITRTVIDRF